MTEKWEEVAEGTQRLGVDGGWLYKVGASLAFVPTAISATLNEISGSLDTLAGALDEIATLFDGTTFSVSGGRSRAIRTCDIGD
jgi:hypothetical protein